MGFIPRGSQTVVKEQVKQSIDDKYIPVGPRGPRGPVGPPGPATAGSVLSYQSVQESPDGAQTVFSSAIPFLPASLMVFLNGIYEFNVENITPTSFEFTSPPETGDTIQLAFSPA